MKNIALDELKKKEEEDLPPFLYLDYEKSNTLESRLIIAALMPVPRIL